MNDGAVRPRRRDGVEADVLEPSRLAAQLFELHRRRHFVDLAGGGLVVEPGEEPRHGHTVAQMRGVRALDLGCVLDRLLGDARVAASDECFAGRFEHLRKFDRRRLGVDLHARARGRQRRFQRRLLA